MKRNKIGHHWCPVYRYNVYFFLGWSFADFKKYMKRRWEHDLIREREPEGLSIFISTEGNDIALIWLRSKNDMPALVHEAYHVMVECFNSRGVKSELGNDEQGAYWLQSVVRAALA